MRRFVLVSALLMALAAGCDSGTSAPVVEQPTEASYQGKSLTQWLTALDAPAERQAALRALRSMRPDDARVVPAIADCLGDSNATTRELAGAALATIGDAGLAAATAKLTGGTAAEQEGAAAALAAAGSRGMPQLISALAAPSATARAAAAEALKGMGASAKDALVTASKSGGREQRIAALQALSGLDGDDALVDALGDTVLEATAREALIARGEAARPALEKGASGLGAGPQARELLALLDATRAHEVAGSFATGGQDAVDAAIELGPAAVDALAPLLGNANEVVRKNAVAALVGIGYAAETPARERLVSINEKERRAAAEVLGGIKSESSLRMLEQALGSDNVGTRETVVEYVASNREIAGPVLTRALAEGSLLAKKTAAGGMVHAGSPGISSLREAMRTASKQVRLIAVDALATAGHPATDWLIAGLANDDLDVVARVEALLVERGAGVVSRLLLQCTQPGWAGRAHGLAVLEKIGEDALDPLLAAALVGSPSERSLARRLLGPMGPSAVRKLTPQLKDENASVRAAAAEALLVFVPDSPDAARALSALTGDSDPAVRSAAIHGIGALEKPSKEQRKTLASALRDTDGRVRVAAAAALLKANPKDKRARSALDAAWDDADDETRLAAFHVTYDGANRQSRALVLERALRHGQPRLVRAAALGRLEQLTVGPELAAPIRLANHDPDPLLQKRGKVLFEALTSDEWLSLSPSTRRLDGWEAARKSRKNRMRERTDAVALALEWFKNHQSRDGRWSCSGFERNCKLNHCGGAVETPFDPGVTGMVLCAFLANGNTPSSGPYADVVKKGLQYLIKSQDSEGCFGPRTMQSFQYNHAFASLAVVEAFGMTGAEALRLPAQRAVRFVEASQNPYLAWRYGVRDGDNDTSVTGCMIAVLRAAKRAELEVDGGSFRGGVAWIEKMTEPEYGRVGYQQRGGTGQRYKDFHEAFPVEQGEPLTAIGLTVRFAAGQVVGNEFLRKGADLILKKPPRWNLDSGAIDFYYWYWGTVAMWEVGGKSWTAWRDDIVTALVENQRTETGRDERGSWDPVGPWSPGGGRIYTTAMACLALQIEWRYPERKGSR